MLTTEQFIIVSAICLACVFIGMVIGYEVCSRDWRNNVGKVAKMTWSETLRKYQESVKR